MATKPERLASFLDDALSPDDLLGTSLVAHSPTSAKAAGSVGEFLDRATSPTRLIATGFGADNTGSSWVDTAIQSMIALMPAAGGVIHFPAGTYRFQTGNFNTNGKPISFTGEGEGATYVSISHATNNVFILNSAGATVGVRDMTIFPWGVTRTGGAYIKCDSGVGIDMHDTGINNVTMLGHYIGVDMVRAGRFRMRDCFIGNYANSFAGLIVDNLTNGDSGDSSVSGCCFTSNGTYAGAGIIQRKSGGLRIVNNKFNVLARGYALELNSTQDVGALAGTSILIITANSFENFTNAAIDIKRTAGSAIFTYFNITSNEFAYAPTLIRLTDTGSTFYDGIITNNILVIPSGGGTAITLDGGNFWSVDHNLFDSVAGIGTGIQVTSNSQNWRLGNGNRFRNVPTQLSGAGTNTIRDEKVNVRGYGATGNGTTDDTAAINACIAANAGRQIYFPRGTYVVSSQILVSVDGTKLLGDGRGLSKITKAFNGDAIVFAPAADVTYLDSCAIVGITITGLTTATGGAGVVLRQCQGFTLDDIGTGRCPEGIRVEGGQLNTLTNIRLRASTLDNSFPDLALLTFKEADLGGGVYQPCFTNEVSGFHISGGTSGATMKSGYCIRIGEVDGLNFSNGYINYASDSLFVAKAFIENQSSSAVHFDNTYFDAVNAVPHCVSILEDAFTNSWFYGITFSSTCILANSTSDAVYVTKSKLGHLNFAGPVFQNITAGRSIYVAPAVDSNRTQVSVTGGQTANAGGFHFANVDQLTITGHQFSRLVGTYTTAVKLAGTVRLATIAGNGFNGCAVDIDQSAATLTVPLIRTANTSDNATNTAMGSTFGNQANADTKTLDWYEEVFFSPTLTFGNNASGITYSVQDGRCTRIGNVVEVKIHIAITSKGSSTGTARLGTLPWQSSSGNSSPIGIRFFSGVAGVGANHIYGYISANQTLMTIEEQDPATGNPVVLTNTAFSNTSVIQVSGRYFV